LQKDPNFAFQIPWEKWEHIVAGAYHNAGFDKVVLTPRSGDHGKDVIATMSGHGSVRIIDQVKAYKRGHLVTANDLRAMLWVLHNDGASQGFVTTTSDFAPGIWTDPTIAPYVPSRLKLINGTALLPRLQELARK
jgi:restriction system protein